MKLGTLIDRGQELADRKDTSWDGRCTRFVNEAIKQWSTKLPWPTLQRAEDFTFNSRESTGRVLTLPQYVQKVLRVADDTNNVVLRPGNSPDLDFPNKHLDNAAGAALFYRELGFAALHKQPASAAAIRVQSTASDAATIYVSGLALDTSASGTPDELYLTREEIITSGSSITSGSKLFVRVDTIGKDVDSSNSDILVSTAADGQLARLCQDDEQTRYRQLELLNGPPDGTIFQIEYLLKPHPLRATNDHAPPAVDPDYIIWYVASMIHRAQGNIQEAEVLLARANEILEREATFEKNAGDQDFRSFPEPLYWAGENQYAWPEN